MTTATDQGGFAVTRRRFLADTSALGAASLLGLPQPAAAEPPPEIGRIRFLHDPFICLAPQYLAAELLRLEGFSEVEYFNYQSTGTGIDVLAQGRVDMAMWDAPSLLPALDAGTPVVVLAGIHAGCWELFGNDRVQAIRDIKGKRVAIHAFLDVDHTLIASMLAYVGIDPQSEVNWVLGPTYADAMRLFVEDKADAYLGSPPRAQELRARGIGHVIVNGVQDRPWSQYFCCVVTANREFVTRYPIAAKRAVRAYLKAADICAREPERAAHYLVVKGYAPSYDSALEVLKSLPYGRWRDTHPEDTMRFFALRLHEVGMIKSTPQKIIAQGTDWRFLNELKRELKA